MSIESFIKCSHQDVRHSVVTSRSEAENAQFLMNEFSHMTLSIVSSRLQQETINKSNKNNVVMTDFDACS